MSNETKDTMLYKAGGVHEIHGGKFDYIIVDANQEGALEKAIEEGWSLTTDEAKEQASKKTAKQPADKK